MPHIPNHCDGGRNCETRKLNKRLQTCTPEGTLVCFTLVCTQCQFSLLKSKVSLDIPAIKRKMGLRYTLNFVCRYPHLLWISKLRSKTGSSTGSTPRSTWCALWYHFLPAVYFVVKLLRPIPLSWILLDQGIEQVFKRAKMYVWSLISEKKKKKECALFWFPLRCKPNQALTRI